MLRIEHQSEARGYLGTIFRDDTHNVKLLTRIATADDSLDGFAFAWVVGEDREREFSWDSFQLSRYEEVKYVFDRERCITHPVSEPPPYDWMMEVLSENQTMVEKSLRTAILEILEAEKVKKKAEQ